MFCDQDSQAVPFSYKFNTNANIHIAQCKIIGFIITSYFSTEKQLLKKSTIM